MSLYRLGAATPRIAPTAYVAPGARVVGRVVLDEHSSIWFGAVLRGDLDEIRIGAGSNVQDNAVLHVNAGEPCWIGRDVTIGHGAIVHGCTIEDECLIGMGAVVLSRARIGRGSLVGAGAVVPEGKVIPPGSLVLGVPARVVRALTPEEQAEIRAAAARYRENARRFATELTALEAHSQW
ncbi:hexapeptide repeat-containing transferase [Thermaerobacter marianensis DSM 12885]|uniref:Hexapeptide repeat-containing transferase n=1 Tax=Thermaerobacter marianensis (strain ATCC 700841 / DSM 12885 / JCM 10246 / 7p75a) TaxID=644966 RepID=E6SIK2_THEM7|nr:gamma carbonic anhydrase family protein [Thermaerobacter marianensis]ADU50908.1 hexapeptide repeat-containing transferase [Thermaerobacter marianensis DSM 12885]